MKLKFEYINSKDLPVKPEQGMYYFIGGRGASKSLAQLKRMKDIITLCDDIKSCNKELDKIKNRGGYNMNLPSYIYAEKYAKKHHITVEEAKEHLIVKEYEAAHKREDRTENNLT